MLLPLIPRGCDPQERVPARAGHDLTQAELALLRALSSRAVVQWDAAASASALSDDALSDALELLLARRALRIVRSSSPAPVSLALTSVGTALVRSLDAPAVPPLAQLGSAR